MSKSIIEEIKEPASALLLEKEGIDRYRQKTVTLDKNVVFKEGIIYYKEIECGSYDFLKRYIRIDEQKAINGKGTNVITNHTAPITNATIEVVNGKNTHISRTDHLGRKIYQKDTINQKVVYRRDSDAQMRGKLFKDEDGFVDTHFKNKPQGGHFQAASAGGTPDSGNIFPQAHRVNNSSEWKSLEEKQRKMYEKEEAFTSAKEIKYLGESKQPNQVSVSINDCEPIIFNNSNSPEVPITATNWDNPILTDGISSSKLFIPNKTITTVFSTNNPNMLLNIPKNIIKPILGIFFFICLLFLFLWFKHIYPFEKNLDTIANAPKINSEKTKTLQNTNETSINKNISLGFAKPLDTLTKSTTKLNDYKESITIENTIPVIGVIFKYNSAELSNEGINILEDFVKNYKKIDVKNYLLIEGYSCLLGTQEYNLKLSEKRAFSLESELMKLGIKEESIKLMSFGKIKFVSSKHYKNDLEINRRSNITIIPIN